MRVCIDGTPFENDFQLGIWRAVYETASRLSNVLDITLWLGAPAVRPLPLKVTVVEDSSRRYLQTWQVAARARRLTSHRWPPRQLRHADVYHSTYFTPMEWADSAPVVTVYDMIAERCFPICGDWCAETAERKRQSLQAAARCICISQATADDLVAFYPELRDRVRVVPLGADHLVTGASPDGRREPSADPYVLFVGQRSQYKNFWLLLDAMRTRAWPGATSLHVVGDAPTAQERTLIARYGLSDRVTFLGRLNDTDLAGQYATARCFVFPSLLEGYGLPLLEAQANGCPVAASDIAVFREVAEDSAVYFDPHSAERVAEAISETFDPGRRRVLIEAGFENVPRFTWDRTAEGTLQVYGEVASHSR